MGYFSYGCNLLFVLWFMACILNFGVAILLVLGCGLLLFYFDFLDSILVGFVVVCLLCTFVVSFVFGL